jgi:hypothetical protein
LSEITRDSNRRFRVLTEAESGLRLAPRATITFATGEGARIDLSSIYRPDSRGTIFPGPLRMTVELDANDMNAAEARALQHSETISALVAYIGNGPVARPKVMVTFEVRSDAQLREYQQFFHDDLGLRSTREVPTDAVGAVATALDGLRHADRQRVRRALLQYRLALAEDDVLERFMMIATAFEALNPLLGARLGIPLRRDEPCPKCGEVLGRPWAGGMYGWIERECGEDVSRRSGRIRNGYVHGYADLQTLAGDAGEVGAVIELALRKAIAYLSSTKIDAGVAPLAPRIPYHAAVVGTISGPVEERLAQGDEYPHLEGGAEIRNSRNVGDRIEVELALNAVARLPEGVGIQVSRLVRPADAGAFFSEAEFSYKRAAKNEVEEAES